MHLEKIKELYPKAFALFYVWWLGAPSYKNRDLYDFFDGLGIIMEMLHYKKPKKQFGYSITHVWDLLQGRADNRTEAEEAGFMKCFEILEAMENDANKDG